MKRADLGRFDTSGFPEGTMKTTSNLGPAALLTLSACTN
jgi:hypothetical protein